MTTEGRLRSQNPVDLLRSYFREKKISEEFGINVSASPLRFSEQARFTLHLFHEPNGELSLDPVFAGLFSAGRASQNIQGWVDGDYFETTVFPHGRNVSLSESLLDTELFKVLGGLVPQGGSFMVSYSLFSKESKIHRETRRGLDRGYPPAVTPLGFLLFSAGCGMGFKDWYFAEGGREGPEKLQGYKPIDSETARGKGELMLRELKSFHNLRQDEDDRVAQACRFRAERVMQELQKLVR